MAQDSSDGILSPAIGEHRVTGRVAWSTVVLSVALVASGLLLSLLAYWASEGRVRFAPHQFLNPVITLTFPIVGALVASRHPRNPVGWMLMAIGFLSSLDLLALGYGMYSQAVTANGSLPGTALADWLRSWIWFPTTTVPLTFLLLLFPDGRLLSSRWRPIAWVAGLGVALGVTGLALTPSAGGSAGQSPAELTPVTSAAADLVDLAYLLWGVGLLGSLASLIVRSRRSSARQRDQLKWLIYTVTVVLLVAGVAEGFLIALEQPEPVLAEVGIMGSGLLVMSIIVAFGIAILRHRLYDIDILINRTLVYGALTGILFGAYLLVVGALGALLHARGNLALSLAGVGLVALVAQPIRQRLQRGVNRVMYGERDDPYAVLVRLGKRLEGALAPDVMLATLVETVAQSLKLPFVAIEWESEEETGLWPPTASLLLRQSGSR